MKKLCSKVNKRRHFLASRRQQNHFKHRAQIEATKSLLTNRDVESQAETQRRKMCLGWLPTEAHFVETYDAFYVFPLF